MKNKNQIWYIGYILSLLLILVIFFTDFSKMVDLGLVILFSAVFGISHVQVLHHKMMKNDTDYKIDVLDERNMMIKEKVGNVANMINTAFLGLATVIFICLDYVIPAIVTGMMVTIQPIILITVSHILEKKL